MSTVDSIGGEAGFVRDPFAPPPAGPAWHPTPGSTPGSTVTFWSGTEWSSTNRRSNKSGTAPRDIIGAVALTLALVCATTSYLVARGFNYFLVPFWQDNPLVVVGTTVAFTFFALLTGVAGAMVGRKQHYRTPLCFAAWVAATIVIGYNIVTSGWYALAALMTEIS